MFITGVGTAVPEKGYSQQECWNVLKQSSELSRLNSRSQAILRKVLTGDNGIETRHFVLERLEDAFALDSNVLHERFACHAPKLAAAAAGRALHSAGLKPEMLDALIVTTCTGYICPGLTSHVSELLGLNSNVFLLDLVGHGCGAALPAMQNGSALIGSGQAENVLVISVEICSAAFYLDNDPGVLISACLFGDGAGAVVLSDKKGKSRPVKWGQFATTLNWRDRELLRFQQRDGMLRNVLDKGVPFLVGEHVQHVLGELQKRTGLARTDIKEWILHAGGRDVLAAISGGLGLAENHLRWSTGVLRKFGNVSSPSVIFALEDALRQHASGGTWFLAAFGAGISCHGVLLDVE